MNIMIMEAQYTTEMYNYNNYQAVTVVAVEKSEQYTRIHCANL